ncbi:free fatty acid receptor 2-like [Brachyhypopomus gauderio]|uniref:free fatty acid receptor 2-like n=1 Tax=Brachyhypopomus gauderio TaxID=698409 RepID=UPI0040422018
MIAKHWMITTFKEFLCYINLFLFLFFRLAQLGDSSCGNKGLPKTHWNGSAMQECEQSLCLSIYIITFITGFPSNILAFYTFGRKVWRKPAPIDILLLNLTISDLLFLLFLPFKMQEVANGMIWDMPYFLCPLSGFVFYMTIYNSTFFLTAVSVERYLGVAYPIRHSLWRRPIYAVAASIFLWILSFLHLSIVYIMPYYDPAGMASPPRNVCYEEFTEAQLHVLLPVRLELCVVLFCVPLVICCFCYVGFIRVLSRLPNIGRRRRLRAIGLGVGTLLVFAVCFGPYNVSHVVGFVMGQSPGWRDKALLLSTFNACLDPLIFYLSSAAVRRALGSLVRGVQSRLEAWTCVRNHQKSSDSKTEKTGTNPFPKPVEINAL